MRIAFVVGAIVVAIGASTARACELTDLRQPGESRASADDRLHRQFQKASWADSDVVFVGELIRIAREPGVNVEVRPIGSLKGEVGSALVRYELDSEMLQCGLLSWPTMEDPGVYFANRESDGSLRVEGMLTYDNVRDQALFNRLRKQLDLEPQPLAVRDGAEAPLARTLPLWAWLAGTASLSLLVGFFIGRVGRKPAYRQKPLR